MLTVTEVLAFNEGTVTWPVNWSPATLDGVNPNALVTLALDNMIAPDNPLNEVTGVPELAAVILP